MKWNTFGRDLRDIVMTVRRVVIMKILCHRSRREKTG